jgi:hypothetical protein
MDEPLPRLEITKCHLRDNIAFVKGSCENLNKIKLILSMNYKMVNNAIFQDVVIKFRVAHNVVNVFNELSNNHYIKDNSSIDIVITI